jgi:biopolymer transport protein ExbD
MKLRRSRTSKRGRIEIIPMIDVMFFLLATFMLASLSMQRLDAIQVNLPQGQASAIANNQPLTLTISKSNEISVNRQVVPLDQVANAIKPLLRPDGNVVVAADDAAADGVVVHAMLEARKACAQHFLVAVQRGK